MEILKVLQENQILVSSILYMFFVVFVKKLPRQQLYKMGVPFVKSFAFIVNNLLLRFLPKKRAEEVEEGFICSICFCFESWVKLFRQEITHNNTKKDGGK